MNTVCNLKAKATPKSAKDVLYFLFSKLIIDIKINETYIESHCAHKLELKTTVGKNNTIA